MRPEKKRSDREVYSKSNSELPLLNFSQVAWMRTRSLLSKVLLFPSLRFLSSLPWSSSLFTCFVSSPNAMTILYLPWLTISCVYFLGSRSEQDFNRLLTWLHLVEVGAEIGVRHLQMLFRVVLLVSCWFSLFYSFFFRMVSTWLKYARTFFLLQSES